MTPQRVAKIMSKIKEFNCHLVVKYYDSWIDHDKLYLQMEYCSNNLRNVLEAKALVFQRKKNQTMFCIEYYISCEIFGQITEALNYLHSSKPEPLIHRDLKPENILIGMSGKKRICKLADFGFTKFIEECPGSISHSIGNPGYAAPEVMNGMRYDIKADIYSLGLIGLKIFDIPNYNPKEKRSNFLECRVTPTIGPKLKTWDRLLSNKRKNPSRYGRISCNKILSKLSKLGIKKKHIPNYEQNLYFKKFVENNYQYFIDIIID